MVKVSGVEEATTAQYGPDVVGPPPYYADHNGDRVVTTNTVTYVTDGSAAALPPPTIGYVSTIGRIDTADPVNVQ
ncbi:hypothetical protein RvY_12471-2 [Ramazzottius varieornatus]|nr:hypothetical protein RvY_12471-2 [Ramazzottius varieornatus]